MSSGRSTLFITLAVAIALTRLAPVAASMFDWDEAQFAHAVRDFDVVQHQPHPPGYPLFVGAAKLLHLAGAGEFRSLQAVVVLGAMLLFPALFALGRALGFDYATSMSGAAIFAFLPNVWLYGGTGFSDVPAAAAGLAASALLLAGRNDSRRYLAGAAVLAVAAGIRPTSLLVGMVPALLATRERWRSARGVVVVAMLAGALIVGAAYAGAALASESPGAFLQAVRDQQQWVRNVDSWRSPTRPPLYQAAKMFWLWPVQQRALMVALALLALASLAHAVVKRRPAPLLLLATFAPAALFAWLNLDTAAAGRYAIGYMGAHALLAADGCAVLVRRRATAQAALSAAIVLVMVLWTIPGLLLQRSAPSPPWAALQWSERSVPAATPLYVFAGFTPLSRFGLTGREYAIFERPEEMSIHSGVAWALATGRSRDGVNFSWPRETLWRVLRRRNFEVSLRRVANPIAFGEGWYGAEVAAARIWRWMAAESVLTLPAVDGAARLSIAMSVPEQLQGDPPTIEVRLGERVLDRFTAPPGEWRKSWTVEAAPGERVLVLKTSRVLNMVREGLGADGRDLGLRLDALTWTPLR